MARYDSLHEHTPDIREDYHMLQKEVRNVKQWRPFTDALAQLSKTKAMSAVASTQHNHFPPSSAERQLMTLEAGDTAQFATGGEDPKADAWVQSNTPKFAVEYGKVPHGAFFIFVGKSEVLTRVLNAAKQVELWPQSCQDGNLRKKGNHMQEGQAQTLRSKMFHTSLPCNRMPLYLWLIPPFMLHPASLI